MKARVKLPTPRAILPPLIGLGLGAAAGWACSRIGTPIPWMMGPLVAMAVLKVAGANVSAIPGGRQVGQWIIGTALGLYFTPAVVREVAGWWPLLAVGAVFAVVLGYASGIALAHMAAIDRTTAIFGSVPGGAAEMSVLGERFGARVDRVASAQGIRLIIVVTTVPTLYALLGVRGVDPYVPGVTTFAAGGFALLMAATGIGGLLVSVLRLPNAFVLGSLAVAIPLTAMEINLSATPTIASNAGQCLLGCALGARFERDFFHGAPRFVPAVVASVVGAIAISGAFGWIAAQIAGLHPATVVLGVTPGGIAEMSVTAKVLQLGVPLVTSFHVTRVVALLLCTAPLFARVRAWRQRRSGAGK